MVHFELNPLCCFSSSSFSHFCLRKIEEQECPTQLTVHIDNGQHHAIRERSHNYSTDPLYLDTQSKLAAGHLITAR